MHGKNRLRNAVPRALLSVAILATTGCSSAAEKIEEANSHKNENHARHVGIRILRAVAQNELRSGTTLLVDDAEDGTAHLWPGRVHCDGKDSDNPLTTVYMERSVPVAGVKDANNLYGITVRVSQSSRVVCDEPGTVKESDIRVVTFEATECSTQRVCDSADFSRKQSVTSYSNSGLLNAWGKSMEDGPIQARHFADEQHVMSELLLG